MMLAEKTKTIQSDKCWWCSSGKRQSRHHLFVNCWGWAWAFQIKELWRSVGKACEWKQPRATTVRLLFQDERATPTVLTFLKGTKVGRVVTLATPGEDWEGLDERELWPEEAEGQGACGDEGEPGPP